jgi:hypothetical protein
MRVSDTNDSPSASRCLIVVASGGREAGATTPLRNPRPSAVFIAQLIAVAQGVPQSRVRRRGEPDHAAALYAAAARHTQPGTIQRVM